MIGLDNRDGSFFSVVPEGIGEVKRTNFPKSLLSDLNQRVESFEINEEMGKLASGSITFTDDDEHNISFLLKMGTRVKISWGYKKWDTSVSGIVGQTKGDMMIAGLPVRVMYGMVRSPNGSSGADGHTTYSCEFFQTFPYYGANSQKIRRYQTKMNKGLVVKTAMQDLGIDITNQVIAFRRQNEFTEVGGCLQDYETPFKFLVRLSMEWRAIFRVAFTTAGMPIGIFIDPGTEIPAAITKITGAIGLYNEFRRKTVPNPNVKSYTWNLNTGGSGGDSVRIVYVNGKPEFWRLHAATETVQFYKLNTNLMRTQMAKSNPKAQLELYKQWMGEQDMQSLIDQKYYIPVNETTAPQGVGLTMSCQCLGNPLMTAPNKVVFKGSFPDYFLNPKFFFYLNKVTHKISRSGYDVSANIVDAFTISGGTLVG